MGGRGWLTDNRAVVVSMIELPVRTPEVQYSSGTSKVQEGLLSDVRASSHRSGIKSAGAPAHDVLVADTRGGFGDRSSWVGIVDDAGGP